MEHADGVNAVKFMRQTEDETGVNGRVEDVIDAIEKDEEGRLLEDRFYGGFVIGKRGGHHESRTRRFSVDTGRQVR